MSDLFEKIAAGTPPDEPEFEDLPADAWVAVQTATLENGGAAPSIEDRAKQGEPSNYQFRVGLICVGGDSTIQETKHKGRFVFYRAWVHPDPRWDNVNSPVSGKFAGFLNSAYSPGKGTELQGEARKKERWGHTVKTLGEIAKHNGFEESAAKAADPTPGPNGELSLKGQGMLIAMATKAAMDAESQVILVKTKLNTWKDRVTNEPRRSIDISQVEDFTQENITKRGVEVWSDESSPEGTTF